MYHEVEKERRNGNLDKKEFCEEIKEKLRGQLGDGYEIQEIAA